MYKSLRFLFLVSFRNTIQNKNHGGMLEFFLDYKLGSKKKYFSGQQAYAVCCFEPLLLNRCGLIAGVA